MNTTTPAITINITQVLPAAFPLGESMSAQPIGDERYILKFPGTQSHDNADPEAGWSMRQCYDAWFRDFVARNRSKVTLSNEYTAIKHWEAFVAERRALDLQSSASRKSPALISAVDEDLLLKFRLWCQSRMSNQSVRRVEATIGKIVRKAERKGLIAAIEPLPKIQQKRVRPASVTLDEVQRLIDAAHVATWPKNLDAPLFWRTILFCFWVTGLRTQDLVGLRDRTVTGLCWASIVQSKRCPDQRIKCESPSAYWFDVQPRKTERSCGLSILLPMHPVIVPLLERFRGLDAQRVFPVPRSGYRFGQQFAAIRDAAGLDSSVSISADGSDGRRSIRKGCRNNWDELDGGLGEVVVPHGSSDVDTMSYKQALPKICRRIEDLPVPVLSDNQQRLF